MDKKQIKIIKLLKKFKADLNKKIKVEQLILFGSQATGNAKKTSDVDLLLISKDFKGKKYFKRSPDLYLMWDYNYNVDILCLTPQELRKKQKEIGIINEAIKQGIII